MSQLYMIDLRRLCSNILVLEFWISLTIIHLTCLLLCLIPPGYAQMPNCLDACVPVITSYGALKTSSGMLGLDSLESLLVNAHGSASGSGGGRPTGSAILTLHVTGRVFTHVHNACIWYRLLSCPSNASFRQLFLHYAEKDRLKPITWICISHEVIIV